MNDVKLLSRDKRFGLKILDREVDKIIKECIKAGKNETGGILVGYYSDNLIWANVTRVLGPTIDSKIDRTWFYRGVIGTQQLLNFFWKNKKDYYLGEWHYHPGASPVPSFDDKKQMVNISSDKDYKCPEPIMLIIGGDENIGWECNAMVFPKNKNYITLDLIQNA